MGSGHTPWPGQGALIVSILVGLTTTLAVAFYLKSTTTKSTASESLEPAHGDHAVLKNYSTTRSFKTPFAKYESLRSFYRPHAHHEKLEAIADLPLLVFIHGLGGSLDQFAPLLSSLVNVAPCFGIELPGHGLSKFEPDDYDAYTTSAIKVLWRTAIQEICAEHHHKKVVLIGHSYGCSISALLGTDPKFQADAHVSGIIAICPKAGPPTYSEVIKYKAFLSLPNSWLDLFRWWDRRGGVDSASVRRFVGEGAGIDQRTLQLRYNEAFRTPVWKRTAMGALPEYDAVSRPIGGLPGRETWAKLRVPLFLIAGEGDKVTKPSELAEIVAFLQKPNKVIPGKTESEPIPIANSTLVAPPIASSSRSSEATTGVLPDITTTRTGSSVALKTATLAAPAAHALLYDHHTYRTVAGLIGDFLSSHVSEHLSLGWQLQQLTTTGKWDVKNLEKWRRTKPVSDPIGPTTPPSTSTSTSSAVPIQFRALKTLREQDPEHSPTAFLAHWSTQIYAVIDISHDPPQYSPHTLEQGGVQYHKFPTVSKIPPTPSEVRDFIALVDRLHAEIASRESKTNEAQKKAIGVHCHYGYNRTGFFICAYLVEREGYDVERALKEFADAKSPGIKHGHFVDALWGRYTVGLRRAPTLRTGVDDEDDDEEG